MPPLSSSERHLPSSQQLSLRLAQLAKAYDLSVSSDATSGDIGEFLAVGMDSYLGDVLHGLVRMTGHDRPGQDTVRIPEGLEVGEAKEMMARIKREIAEGEGILERIEDEEKNDDADRGAHNGERGEQRRRRSSDSARVRVQRELAPDLHFGPGGELPKPNIETLHHLFTLVPELHQQASPALYKLASSQTLAEAEYNESKPVMDRDSDNVENDDEDEGSTIPRRLRTRTRTLTQSQALAQGQVVDGDVGIGARSSGNTNTSNSGRRQSRVSANGNSANGGDGDIPPSVSSDFKPLPGPNSQPPPPLPPPQQPHPARPKATRHLTTASKSEQVQQHLLANGLLKIDKAGGEGGGGESKKDKKHNLHWKYEDPAMIFRDVLG